MMVYVDDDQAVFVEQLSLDEARSVVKRARAALPWAFNSAHAAALRSEITEVEDQIDWLEGQECAAAAGERAAEMVCDLWADHEMGLPD